MQTAPICGHTDNEHETDDRREMAVPEHTASDICRVILQSGILRMGDTRAKAPSFLCENNRLLGGRLTEPTARNGVRIPGFDGLRGIACLAVFAVHFQQHVRLAGAFGPFELPRLLENGNHGVALFFALSGFLLGLPLWECIRSHRVFPPLRTYWAKRLVRVVPAYFVCLTALIVLNRHGEKLDGWRDIVLHYTFLFNFREASVFSINPPFWTLAVEVQFYLLLPFFVVLVRNMKPAAGGTCLLAFAAASYVAYWLVMESWPAGSSGIGRDSPVLQYSLPAHLPHFLLGTAAGVLYLSLRDRGDVPWLPGVSNLIFCLCGALVLVTLATPLDNLLKLPYGRYNWPFVPILLTAMIVFAPFSPPAATLLESSPLRLLGVISYGVYIYHLPVQNATGRYMTMLALNPVEHWMIFGAVSLLLTALVASLSYSLLELPFRRIVRRSIGRGTGNDRSH